MLNPFKKSGPKMAQEQADKLQALIDTSRKEQGALSRMLAKIKAHGSKITQVSESLQQVNDRAAGAQSKLGELTTRMSTVEAESENIRQIEAKIRTLGDSVSQAEGAAQRLLAPDGELKKHEQAVQQLSSQTIQTTADLAALREQQTSLKQLREELREAQKHIKGSTGETSKIKSEFDRLRGAASQLQVEHGRMKDALRTTQEDAAATTKAVMDVEKKFAPLAELADVSKTTAERLATLNSLAEHVGQKVKALEKQKHTVEHAVVESNRLSEMIWKMEVQIQELNEGAKQTAQADEALSRIEQISVQVAGQLEQSEAAKAGFSRDLVKLEKNRTELSVFVRRHAEQLALDRKTSDSLGLRLKTLQDAIPGLEKSIDGLNTKDKAVVAVAKKADDLVGQFTALSGQAEELEARHAALGDLEERLDHVEELGKRAEHQQETLLSGRQQLQALRKELDEFYKTEAEITKTREQVGADRQQVETFLKRVEEFRRDIPEFDSRMDALTSKLSVVQEGSQKAATLVSIAGDLDSEMARIVSKQQRVEKIETRLISLTVLSTSIDQRVEEQLTRRNEVESLKNACDGLGLQVSDAHQKLEAVSSLQHKLLPLTTQVAMLKTGIDKAKAAFKETQRDETELASQEKRLSKLMDGSRSIAAAVEERLGQVHELTEQLAGGTAVKDELVRELGRVQGRQRDVAAHGQASEQQIKRVDAQLKQLDQRHSQLAFAEKKLEAFEERLTHLQKLSGGVEEEIRALDARQAVVGSVKNAVDEVYQLGQRSRADLRHVAEHRDEVDQLRRRVDVALKGISETEDRIAVIEARKKVVDEVQLKTTEITHVLEDVRVNLELLSEQRSVVDHVVESSARLNETVQSAQATLQALQGERELAQRIERGIKALRTSTSGGGRQAAGGEQFAGRLATRVKRPRA